MSILEQIKDQAIEVKLAAEKLIDAVEAAETRMAEVFGALGTPSKRAKTARVPREKAHGVTALHEPVHDRRSDDARSACDENLHAAARGRACAIDREGAS